MQTLYLDDTPQIRGTSRIVLVNTRPMHEKLQLLSETVEKEMTINPCSSLRLQISDGSVFRASGDKDFAFRFGARINSSEWWTNETVNIFYDFIVSSDALETELRVPKNARFRADVDALKDVRVCSIMKEIKDEQFQEEYEKLVKNTEQTYSELPTITVNEIFARDLAALLNESQIEAPEEFDFGRSYKTAVLRAVLSVICRDFRDFPDSLPLRPASGEEILSFLPKRCVLEAERASNLYFEEALRGDVDSLKKVLAEAIHADFYEVYSGRQIFEIEYREDGSLDAERYARAGATLNSSIFAIEDKCDLLVCNHLIEEGILPTPEAIKRFSGQPDIDVALCTLLLRILGPNDGKSRFRAIEAAFRPLDDELQRQADSVVIFQIQRIQAAARRGLGRFWQREKALFQPQSAESEASDSGYFEEIAHFQRSYGFEGGIEDIADIADISGNQQLIGSQIALQRQLQQMQRQANTLLRQFDAEISENSDNSGNFGNSGNSSNSENAYINIEESLNETEGEYSQIANRLPADLSSDAGREGLDREEISDIANRLIAPGSSAGPGGPDEAEGEYSVIVNRAPDSDIYDNISDEGDAEYSVIVNNILEESEGEAEVAEEAFPGGERGELSASAGIGGESPSDSPGDAPGVALGPGGAVLPISEKKPISYIEEADNLLERFSLPSAFAPLLSRFGSPFEGVFRLLWAREVIIGALCVSAAGFSGLRDFERLRRAAVALQRWCRQGVRCGGSARAMAAVAVEEVFRGRQALRFRRLAREDGLPLHFWGAPPRSSRGYFQLLFAVSRARRVILLCLQRHRETSLRKIRAEAVEIMGDCAPLFCAFIDHFGPETYAETAQLILLYNNAICSIRQAAAAQLARRSRRVLVANRLEAFEELDFLRPSSISEQAHRLQMAHMVIQMAARQHLELMCKSASGPLFAYIQRHFNTLSFSKHVGLANIIRDAAVVIQESALRLLEWKSGDPEFSCPLKRVRYQRALQLIANAVLCYKIDCHNTEMHCKALLTTSIHSLEDERQRLEAAARELEQFYVKTSLYNYRQLYTLKMCSKDAHYVLERFEWRFESVCTCENVFLRYGKLLHSVLKVQAVFRSHTCLEEQWEDERAKKVRQIFARIAFLRENPAISLSLHAEILQTTDTPERHIRSLLKLQNLELPYHEKLMAAVVKCALNVHSKSFAFTILQTYLPINFETFLRDKGDVFSIIDSAIQCKTIESARFLKNISKTQPMTVVSKVRQIVQWRKQEKDEEIRRLLKGALHYCQN